jgi:hypothetical protein
LGTLVVIGYITPLEPINTTTLFNPALRTLQDKATILPRNQQQQSFDVFVPLAIPALAFQ